MTNRRTPRQRKLSPDERRLWERAMRQTERLDAQRREPEAPTAAPSGQGSDKQHPDKMPAPSRQPAPHAPVQPVSDGIARRALMRHQGEPTAGRRPGGPVTLPHPAFSTNPAAPAGLLPLSRREARRIARERDRIDARLDLHGMRQHEAHRALRRFLNQCDNAGCRLVLVITGKGNTRAEDEAERLLHESPRGILRTLVPVWLEAPELRPIIASVSQAHVRDGGHGALYVRLKARRAP